MARVLSERLRPGDVLVPAALFVVAAVEMLVVRPERWPVALLTEGAAALLLVGRRRWPLAAPTLAGGVLLAQPWLGPAMDEVSGIILFLALSCFSLGRRLPDLRGLVGMAVIWALTFLDYVTVDLRTHDISDVVFVATLSLPPYLFGGWCTGSTGRRSCWRSARSWYVAKRCATSVTGSRARCTT